MHGSPVPISLLCGFLIGLPVLLDACERARTVAAPVIAECAPTVDDTLRAAVNVALRGAHYSEVLDALQKDWGAALVCTVQAVVSEYQASQATKAPGLLSEPAEEPASIANARAYLSTKGR